MKRHKPSIKPPIKPSITSSLGPAKEAKLLVDAQRFVRQENYTQALHCYHQLNREGADPKIAKYIQACQMQLLRRCLKQDKLALFVETRKSYGWKEHLALPLARMQGERALAALAGQGNGVDAMLAACSLEKDLKTALQSLRKLPQYKEMAEGWICLLKGNLVLAQAAFDAAKEKTPYAARIGHALIDLKKGDISRAQRSIAPHIRAFLTRRFPKLSQAMQWNDKENSDAAFRQLFHASRAKIEAGLNQHANFLSNDKKGWFNLRLGDQLLLERKGVPSTRVFTYWQNALKMNPLLNIDVAKRHFLTASFSNYARLCEEKWRDLCELLEKHAPEDLHAFLSYLSQLPDARLPLLPVSAFRAKEESPHGDQGWLLSAPSSNFYLLFCRLIAQRLSTFDQCLQLPVEVVPEKLPIFFLTLDALRENALPIWDNEDWKNLESLLPLLDSAYGENLHYLKARYAIARVMGDGHAMRSTMYRRLLQDPGQRQILMPRYVAALFQGVLKEWMMRKSKKSFGKVSVKVVLQESTQQDKIFEELTQLHQKFPDDYDMIRLILVCQYEQTKAGGRVIAHTGHLSRQLTSILHCQFILDTEGMQKTVLSSLPKWEDLQGYPEAQERWLQLVCDPLLQNEKKWQAAIDHLSEEELHTMLKNIETRGERLLPSSFVNAFSKKHGATAYTKYHEGLQLLRSSSSSSDMERALDMFSECEDDFDRDHKDFASMSATLFVYTACHEMEEVSDPLSFILKALDLT